MEKGTPIVLRRHLAHDRVGFSDELWNHTDVLTPDEFQAKLDQYDPSGSNRSFEVNLDPLPVQIKSCYRFLNRLFRQVRRM